MYDIKRLEAGQQSIGAIPIPHSCLTGVSTVSQLTCPSAPYQEALNSSMTLLTLRRRRVFQRRACLLSILAAFVLGMALGVILPLFGLPDYFSSSPDSPIETALPPLPVILEPLPANLSEQKTRPRFNFPTIYERESREQEPAPYTVAFVKDVAKAEQVELSAEQTFRHAFHLKPEKAEQLKEIKRPSLDEGIIKSDVFWGDIVERALPKGFAEAEQRSWQRYVAGEGVVLRLEPGCGRMQNRLVVFADGTRACARYRQNTDQIQGEIFSYYLGQLLNISNLAPSAATVIDTSSGIWSAALGDITQAQWKEQRPVVLTRWLPDLEAAGIPQPFQPLDRHLNKFDVWNMTTRHATKAATTMEEPRGLLKRLEAAAATSAHPSRMLDLSSKEENANGNANGNEELALPLLRRLIELAQWSDLIVFDFLIANLDRYVNNLYNLQWNADIMAAPAHNLARQTNSQLLLFLDNESGLLHGYRLLKKYEAYHSLLLDNLCVFRESTIEALRRLRDEGAGKRLRDFFERTASGNVRDVLPSLPDKSIKILVERIDRVLLQVQKCRQQLADNNNNSNNKILGNNNNHSR